MVKTINEYEWYTQYEHEVFNCDKPIVLVFGAEWCSACDNLQKKLEAEEFHVQVLHLDVDACETLPDEMNITSLPTVVIYENCEVSQVFENNVSAQEIIEYIHGMRV